LRAGCAVLHCTARSDVKSYIASSVSTIVQLVPPLNPNLHKKLSIRSNSLLGRVRSQLSTSMNTTGIFRMTKALKKQLDSP